MAGLKFRDADEIGFQPIESFPDTNPLSVSFTDLLRHVVELEEFDDDPSESNEGLLEAIQMAWVGYFEG